MCSLQRSHDSVPTPTIVSTIPTPEKWEAIIPPGVGVVRSRSRLESPLVFIPLSLFVFHFCTCTSRFWTTLDDSDCEQLQTTPGDSGQLREASDDLERLRVSPSDFWRFQTAPNDFKRLWIALGGPAFRSWFGNNWSRIGFDSGFLQILPITT